MKMIHLLKCSAFPKQFIAVFLYGCFANLCLLFLCEGKLTSLNNKYEPFQVKRSVQIEDFSQINDSDSTPISIIPNRIKRDTTAQSKTKKNTTLVINKSILTGTEDVNQAFVHWIGKETSEKVVVLMCQRNVSEGRFHVVASQLWGSDDYGSSFHKVDINPKAKLSSFYTFPTNSKKLIFTDIEGKTVYTTMDEMKTFNSTKVPVEPDVILPHPSDEDKILLYSLGERKLYASHDFAKSWYLLSNNVLPKFYWGTPGLDDTDLVHMEVASSAPDKSEYKACISPDCKDVTSKVGSPGPFVTDSLIIYKEFMFVQKNSLYGSHSFMVVSHMRQPFQRAFFPGDVKAKDFILLNMDDGQVFVAAIHETSVNLYLSDPTGHQFVLSFSDVYHMIDRYWVEIDLHEVQGMSWTFLVNKKDPSAPNGIRSYISFDKGGNWGPLKVNKDLQKHCKAKNCYLQLNIKQSPFMNGIISSKHAPGLIIAHGTLASVGLPPQPVSVFTSRDGGWTWTKAPFEGIYNLNILDQGSILTAIQDGLFTPNRTATVSYSLDQGASWETEVFDKAGYMVNGVLTEPNIITLSELMFGHEGKHKPWVLIKLNFTQVLESKCTPKEYESWYPVDYNDVTQNNCTLGKLIKYTRRKQNAKCHNGETEIPQPMSNNSCECTREDYECDYGYEEKSSACKKASWYYEGYLPLDCQPGKNYLQSRGYRKVSSDTCEEKKEEKDKYGKSSVKCPVVKPRGLAITSHSVNVAVGKEVTLFLAQAGGSLEGTKYTWTMGDGSTPHVFDNFNAAKQLKYTFRKPGHFKVTVTAENGNGKSSFDLSFHVQDELSDMTMLTPLTGKVGLSVTLAVSVSSTTRYVTDKSDHAHYMWRFGDETSTVRPLLTWDRNVSHTYSKKGTYKVSVEAVNSVGSLYREFQMRVYDDAEVLVLKLQPTGFIRFSTIKALILQRLRNQLADDLGIGPNRIETKDFPQTELSALLFIYPREDKSEDTMQALKQKVMNLVNSGNFGFSLYGRRTEGWPIIKVTSAKTYSSDDAKSGPNMKALIICAPILVIAIIASGIALFLYCRKRQRTAQQYNMLHMQDDSDALLDDEDDPPLDLNIDFRGRDDRRDVPMMDSGGSHLVMQDSAENC